MSLVTDNSYRGKQSRNILRNKEWLKMKLSPIILIPLIALTLVYAQDRPTIGFISPDVVSDIGKENVYFVAAMF